MTTPNTAHACIPFEPDTWPKDADGFEPHLCTDCGTPVRYGSRHSICARKALGLEPAAQPATPAWQAQNYDQPAYLKERHDYWIAEFKAIIEKAGLDYFLSYQAGMAANRDNARRFTASPQPQPDVAEALRRTLDAYIASNYTDRIDETDPVIVQARAALQGVQGGGE